MLRSRKLGRLCALVTAFSFLLTGLFVYAAQSGILTQASAEGYSARLFDTSRVHTINISLADWESFLETCTDEEYVSCAVTIDGEKYSNVALRAKGNTSLSSVQQYGNDRYSLKLEFDHYDSSQTYYGLDKLCLNNLIQDKTMMKDYLAYTLMSRMGVASPECSYVWITINGEDWGLYLAVEGVEEAFLSRNYGSDSGNLYKPDSISNGGGRGNGRDFDFADFDFDSVSKADEFTNSDSTEAPDSSGIPDFANMPAAPEDGDFPDAPGSSSMPDFANMPAAPEGGDFPDAPGGGFSAGGMGSSDVKLQYIDDDPESYSNIFSSAKTKIDSSDQTRLIESLKALSEGDVSVVNTDSVMRYLAVHDFLVNGDSYTGSMVHNYYLYEKDGVLEMIPWDYNLAFGAFSFSSGSATSAVNSPIDSPVSGGNIEDRPMVAWIFQSEISLAAYHAVYAEFIESCLSNGWLSAEIERVYEMIRPYVQKDPTAFYTAEELEQAVSTLQAFCEKRAESILGQLNGTIPSTESGQSSDSSALIDASDLSLSDMGEFNQGGGDFDRGGQTPPNGTAPPDGFTPPNRDDDAQNGTSAPPNDMSVPGVSDSDRTPDDSAGAPNDDGAPSAGDSTAPQAADRAPDDEGTPSVDDSSAPQAADRAPDDSAGAPNDEGAPSAGDFSAPQATDRAPDDSAGAPNDEGAPSAGDSSAPQAADRAPNDSDSENGGDNDSESQLDEARRGKRPSDFSQPDQSAANNAASARSQTWILLTVSVAVLLAGLIFAKKIHVNR